MYEVPTASVTLLGHGQVPTEYDIATLREKRVTLHPSLLDSSLKHTGDIISLSPLAERRLIHAKINWIFHHINVELGRGMSVLYLTWSG